MTTHGEAPGMNDQEFAPFEPRLAGGRSPLDFGLIVQETFILTLLSSPMWAALVLSHGLLFSLTFAAAEQMHSPFLLILALLFQMPSALASYFRILLARKRGERLSLLACLSFGFSRSIRMLATGIVMLLLFWLLTAIFIMITSMCSVLHPLFGGSVGLVLLGCFIYCALRWQLAPVVCVVENQPANTVLERSYRITENRLTPLLGITLAVWTLQLGLDFGIGMAVGGLFEAANKNLAVLLALPFACLLYSLTIMLPLTAQFLCYYAITGGEPPAQQSEDDGIGFSRA